jgi:hypothetical protein
MNGSKLAAIAAVTMGALGTAGMVAAANGDPPPPEPVENDDGSGSGGLQDPDISPEELEKRQEADRERAAKVGMLNAASAIGMGCIVAMLFMVIAYVDGKAKTSALGAAALAAPAPAPRPGRRRVWVRGHPVLGFVSGLFAGIGITVALQQFGVYPLDIVSFVVAPLVVAVLGAVRGMVGKAWYVG